MTRILIIAVAVLLALGGASTALSHAEDQDPGPAIVLDGDAVDDTTSGQGSDGVDDAKHDDEAARVSDAPSDGDDTFTVAHPQPVEADDEPDDAEPDDAEPDDEPSRTTTEADDD